MSTDAEERVSRVEPLLLFDGECNLCNGWVRFVLKHEREPTVLFATLQSEYGKQMLSQYGLPEETLDTVVFIEHGRAMIRSTAVLELTRHLRRPWSFATHLQWIPRFLRDLGYRLVAANRYRVFGKTETCLVPTAETQARFIELDPAAKIPAVDAPSPAASSQHGV